MAGYVVLGMLAAFGFLCALWAMLGWLIPRGEGVCMICPEEGLSLVRRLLWLREVGLLNCPLMVSDTGLSAEEKAWLISHGIEICGPKGPELERNQIDGTGNGDPTGRHQRCGVSEL